MNQPLLNRVIFLQVSVIIILGFFIYGNSLNGKFIWDDHGLVKNNIYIRNWANLPIILTGSFGAGGSGKSNFYRPVQMVIHTVGYSLWKLDVRGYHFTSILMHILAALAIYFLISNIFSNRAISFAASLLFIAHPVNTETVSYISGINDSLSLLFMLLCLTFFIKSRYLNNKALYILSLFSFVFALLSKENAIILPTLILLYYYTFKKNIEVKRIVPFFIILISYFILRLVILGLPSYVQMTFVNLFARTPGFLIAVTEYLRLLLVPFNLHMEYGNGLFKINDPQAILGLLILLSLVILAFNKRKNNPIIFFSVGWFLITLLPVSNIYYINDSFMMEHWVYAPSLGFFLIFADTAYRFLRNKAILITLLASILVFYSYLTIRQNEYWKEPVIFYKRALTYAPNSWRFYNELGIECANLGNYNDAIASYKKAIQINPHLTGIYNNLANAYKAIGNYEEAIPIYEKAIGINPDDALMYYNLRDLYEKIGNKEKASYIRQKLIARNINLSHKYYEMGNKYSNVRDNKKAIDSYKKALELDPNNLVVYNALASLCVFTRRTNQAVTLLEKALEIYPNSSITHNNLAVAYYYEKKYDLAVKHCNKAAELGYLVEPKFLEYLKPYRHNN